MQRCQNEALFAAHWTSLSMEQRTELVELFKSFLSDRYAGKLEGYSGEKVQYLREHSRGNMPRFAPGLYRVRSTFPWTIV